MRVLITGSSGMLGSDLCRVLREKFHVIGIDVKEPLNKDVAPGTLYNLSLEDRDRVDDVLEKEKPDAVIHTAAWTDVDGCEEDPQKAEIANVRCTENIVEAVAALKKVPMIFISTDYVFNGHKSEAYSVEDAVDPLNVYGKTKVEAEYAIKNKLDSYAIIRTSWLFGECGKNFVNTIIKKASEVKEFRVVDDQVASPTFSKDLAEAIQGILEKDIFPGQYSFHITNNGHCSWHEFTEKIMETYNEGDNIPVIAITSDILERPAKRPAYSVLDNDLFNKVIGYSLRKWEDALGAYINECI